MKLPKVRIATLRAHAIVASVALAVDAFLWGGVALLILAALVGFLSGLALMVRGIFAERERILTGALVVATYVVALLILARIVALHSTGAQARAEPVIRAIDAYRAAHGDYPRNLAELVPAYLPSIPRARYTLWMSEYWFSPPVPERDAWLSFTLAPPIGARHFDLDTRRWGNAD